MEKKIFHQGSRCYGTSLDNTSLFLFVDLLIILSTEIRKAMLRMSYKIYCLQKRKKIFNSINKLNIINLHVILMNLLKKC